MEVIVIKEKELGQFFTHPEVARFMVEILNPKDGELIIDPSCGDGEFLHTINNYNPNSDIYGCEIDEVVYNEAKERTPSANIFLHNGLYSHSIYEEDDISNIIIENSFDAIIANPPFNALNNRVKDDNILSLFEVGCNKGKTRNSQSIEVLFLERFVQLLKPNGRLCTVLPEGVLSDSRLFYLRDMLYNNLNIESIISLPKKGVFGNAYVNVVIFCAKKKPVEVETDKVFYVTDTKIEDLPYISEYMKRNRIFYT